MLVEKGAFPLSVDLQQDLVYFLENVDNIENWKKLWVYLEIGTENETFH